MDDILCQFRRGLLQDHFYGIADRAQIVLDRLVYDLSGDLHLDRKPAHDIASDNDHGVTASGNAGTKLFLQLFRSLLSDDQIEILLDVADDGFVQAVSSKV